MSRTRSRTPKRRRLVAALAAACTTVALSLTAVPTIAHAGSWSGPTDNTVSYLLNESSGSQSVVDQQNDDTAYESGSTAGNAAGMPSTCTYVYHSTSGSSTCNRTNNPASALSRTASDPDFQQPAPDTLDGNGITFNGSYAHFNGASRLITPVTPEMVPTTMTSSSPLVWGDSVRLPTGTFSAGGGDYSCPDLKTGSTWAPQTTCADKTNYDFANHTTDSKANAMQVGNSGNSTYGVIKQEISATLAGGLKYGVPTCTIRAFVAAGYPGAGAMVVNDQIVNSSVGIDDGAFHDIQCVATDSDLKVYVDTTLRGTKTYSDGTNTVKLVAPVFGIGGSNQDYMTIGGKRSAKLQVDARDFLTGDMKNVYYKSTGIPATADVGPLTANLTPVTGSNLSILTDVSPTGLSLGDNVVWDYFWNNPGKGAFNASAATFTTTGAPSGVSYTCLGGALPHNNGALDCSTDPGGLGSPYVITQADMDAGHIDGGNVHVSVPSAGTTTPLSTSDIDIDTPIAQNSSLGVSYSDNTTDVDSSGTVNLGDTVNGTYVVTNIGNVTMTGINVAGDVAGNTPSCGVTTLAPGAATNCTFTHTINSTDVLNGQYVAGGGHADGVNPPSEAGNSDSSAASTHTTTIAGASSSMTITETRTVTDLNASSGSADSGDRVVGNYTVTNTGTRTINGIAVTDTKLSGVTCLATTLAGGANTTCTSAPYFILPGDHPGPIGGTSSVTGTDSIGGAVSAGPYTPSSITVGTDSLLIMTRTASVADTNADTVTGDAGDVITYSIGLNNTNSANGLNNITARSYYPAGAGSFTTVSGCPTNLTKSTSTGPTGTCTETHTITSGDVTAGKVSVWAYLHGTWNTIGTLAASNGINIDTPTYATPAPGLALTKATVVHDTNTDGVTGDAGDHITYSYLVHNTGVTTISGISVSDTQSGAPSITCSPTTLSGGGSVTCVSASDYVITSGDVTTGFVSGTATASATSPVVSSNTSFTSDATHASPAQNDKVLLIMLENTPSSQINSTNMPFLTDLETGTAYSGTVYPAASLTQYSQVPGKQPSLPNYLTIAAGNDFGITDDTAPSKHPIDSSTFPSLSTFTVFDQAIANGKTAKVYADGMQTSTGAVTTCRLTDGSKTNTADLFAVRHGMWGYFDSTTGTYPSRTNCGLYMVSQNVAGSTPLQTDVTNGTLPNVGFLAPNLLHDGHTGTWGGSPTTADNYLASIVPTILAGSDFTTGHLSVIITEDEGTHGGTPDPIIPFLVLNKASVAGCTDGTTGITHYGLNHWLSSVAGGSGINNGVGATDPRSALTGTCVPGL